MFLTLFEKAYIYSLSDPVYVSSMAGLMNGEKVLGKATAVSGCDVSNI